MRLLTKFLEEKITYTGLELSPHWIAKKTGVFSSGIVAFLGPCSVETGELVDLEDRFQNSTICAKEMLHFLGEWFETDLSSSIVTQRLLIAGFLDLLRMRLNPADAHLLSRKGNDLYFEKEKELWKLSVSIVTATPVSTLFHFGVNVDSAGAPVKAFSLKEFGIDPKELALSTLSLWNEELASMEKARCKVAAR